MPWLGESPIPFQPNSGNVVRPTAIAPASTMRATTGAEKAMRVAAQVREPRSIE